MRLVEITQDGAGVLPFSQEAVGGIFTKNVASCVVYAFYGKTDVYVIHDTGQLSVSSMRQFVSAAGEINRVYVAHNPEGGAHPAQIRSHRERQRELFALLKCTGQEQKMEIPSGSVAFGEGGSVKLLSSSPIYIEQPPGTERRNFINVLNNIFSEPNSQSLPVDIQYSGGLFTSFPKIIHSFDAMKNRANEEMNGPNQDPDYVRCLAEAHELGLMT